jgi:transcriptional regulator with XRE-family HTH domain
MKMNTKWQPAKIVHPLGVFRVRHGVSRLYLAESSGISYPQLWRWEVGKGLPSEHSLMKWMRSLKKTTKKKVPNDPASRTYRNGGRGPARLAKRG